MNAPDSPIHLWADALEECAQRLENLDLSRAVVLAETASTQAAAVQHSGGKSGLVCIASRQTGGRGRLGRQWADDVGKGVSMTLALNDEVDGARFSLALGVAVAEACADVGPGPRVGLRWPNDVVDRPTGSKIAGVLIEKQSDLTLVGIGINVYQTQEDWQRVGQTGAISLAALDAPADRLALALEVLSLIDQKLGEEPKSLAEQWHSRDTLTGTSQTFEHDGKRVTGLVESIDPTNTLIVRTTSGLVRLPASSTSLVHS
ncbi:MAG: biotin--[acetyl-CoA-carboxylase] ligase [Phycisphaera sp.]|nr:MAG: biotin--[acetyl-CoA-carboxylase] ligase [Phycisphaera sp.]